MKIQIKNYLFDASARTITFYDYVSIDIDSVLYIIHVTDNRAIYNPMNKNLKGSVFGNVLTLNYDTSTMSDQDELQIYYDSIPDPATATNQTTGNSLLTTISASILTLLGIDFATSAKQLPNNHQVTISNPTADPETGLAKEAKQDDIISAIGGFQIPPNDYISRAWSAGTFTEVWTFKTGGSGGTTVGTITIIYDDVDMSNIISVTKT